MPAGGGVTVVVDVAGGGISLNGLGSWLGALSRSGVPAIQIPVIRVFIDVAVANLNISVGAGSLALETATEIILEVVADITAAAEANLPVPLDLRDTPPVQDQLPDTPIMFAHIPIYNGFFYPQDWVDYWNLINQGGYSPQVINVPGTALPPGATTGGGLPTTTGENNDNEEVDVGWFEDAYERVDEEFFGGYLPGGAPPGGEGEVTPIPIPGGLPSVNPVTGAPAVPGTMPAGTSGSCGPAHPVLKWVCGGYRWVYQKRRRRKRLASTSDLKDLAALKGVLGGGKAFEVWIATHG